jgi:hypothetical protein
MWWKNVAQKYKLANKIIVIVTGKEQREAPYASWSLCYYSQLSA